jgi:nucleoid-associated protein YgaU
VPAAPLPWIASDDASAGQTHATPNTTAQTRVTPNAVSKWVVREGDTVYKVCVVTYGSCEERRLRTLLADNPKLGRDATIHPGDIIVLRKRDRSPN